jgi:FKBP-type peptidyl-prolyl cis-trans isomerase
MRLARALPAFAALAVLAACDLSTEPRVPAPIDPANDTYHSSLGINISTMSKTASGVYFKDTEVGDGAEVGATSTIEVNYSGFLPNGARFDSNQGFPPAELDLAGNIIPGFRDGMVGMKVGGERTMVIPTALAYGRDGNPNAGIPPNSNLVFVVELVEVR